MRRTYLTVLTTKIETEGFRYPLRDKPLSESERAASTQARELLNTRPGRLPPFARRDPLDQDNASTYLSAIMLEGMCKEDSRDDLLDVRTYAVGECVGNDYEAHGPVLLINTTRETPGVLWCRTCGALKIDGAWEYPETRIDRKGK